MTTLAPVRSRQVRSAGSTVPKADEKVLTDLYAAHGIGARSRQRASRLLRQTGGISEALACPEPRLRSLGATQGEIQVLQLVGSAISLALRRPAEDRPLLSTLSSVIDYLHAEMAHRPTEAFRVLFLNGRLRLVHDEIMGIGSIASVDIHPRTILARALDVGARHILLVHNHPSGDPTPTREDVQLTARVREAGRMLDVNVLDHIIVARSGHSSLRSEGLM